jgi:hypothetical protein
LDGVRDVCNEQAAAWSQDDGNRHEEGFDVVGKGSINPHAFRVEGETFMNSTAGGMMSVLWWVSLL